MTEAGRKTPRRRIKERSTVAILLLSFAVVAQAHEVDVTSSYVMDFLVTNNWESELIYRHRIGEAAILRGEVGYYDATQDEISGIVRLNAKAGWLKLGGALTTLWNHLVIDAEAGGDLLSERRLAPNGKAFLRASIPIPDNPVLRNLRVKPSVWYTQRLPGAAAIRNRIASWGFEGEATMSMIVQKVDAGCSYRIDNFWPLDTVLDSMFLDTIASGRPSLPIEKNSVNSFYVYAMGKIASSLNLGYAFSWSDSRHDQWIATRREPYVTFRGTRPESGISHEYAYYPYPAPRRSFAHLLVVDVPIIIGPVAWRSKTAAPVYSSREQFSSPQKVPLGQEINYNYYYTQKYTGPLTLESKIIWRVNDRLTAWLAYEYFCLPYRAWAYFTQDSYSYHKATMSLSVEW